MKSHRTLAEAFKASGLPASQKKAFTAGWYSCANEINEGEDWRGYD